MTVDGGSLSPDMSRLELTYVADVETFDWTGGGRCGVYVLRLDGARAGAVSLTSLTRSHGEIGYEIEPRFRGCGLATAAVNQVIASAATGHGFALLSARTLATNAASRRVLEKSGFILAASKLCWPGGEPAPITMITYQRRAPSPSP